MAEYTENLGLTLPEGNDFVNVEDINGNMRAIDDEIGGVADSLAAVNDTLGEVNTSVGTVKDDVASVKADVATVNTNVNANKTTLSTINTNVSAIKTETAKSSTASKTGTLSQKLAYVIANMPPINSRTKTLTELVMGYVSAAKTITVSGSGVLTLNGGINIEAKVTLNVDGVAISSLSLSGTYQLFFETSVTVTWVKGTFTYMIQS